MTDPLNPPVMTYTDKIANNAEVALKSGSTWVVAVFGLLGGIYASLTPAQQAQLVEQFPFLHGWTPIITLVVAFLVAKLKPSNSVSASTQALITEVTKLRLDAFLRSKGATGLPAVEPAPLPAAPAVVAVPVPPAPPSPPPAPHPPAAPRVNDDVENAEPSGRAAHPDRSLPLPSFAETLPNTIAPHADIAPAPPPAPPAREPDEPVTHVDVKLPLRQMPPEPLELPIDPRLLMSLIAQYLRQSKP